MISTVNGLKDEPSKIVALDSMQSDLDLAGKIVLITGATDRIGQETARQLAERGAHVLIHGRDREKAELVRDEII
jgi:NADP-dependent 3-hydroxy acid dehydrogenase YdfG